MSDNPLDLLNYLVHRVAVFQTVDSK